METSNPTDTTLKYSIDGYLSADPMRWNPDGLGDDSDVRDLLVLTSTPAYYLASDLVNLSSRCWRPTFRRSRLGRGKWGRRRYRKHLMRGNHAIRPIEQRPKPRLRRKHPHLNRRS